MAENNNKIITIILVLLISLAALTILYVNLPQESTKENNNTEEEGDEQTDDEVYFTVYYDDEQTEYTLDDLESMDTITGLGGYRTSYPMIKGQAMYTGVPITKLVELLAGDITNYSIIVYSDEEGEIDSITYEFNETQGIIDIYNSTNASDETPISTGGVTMILCYEKDGEYLDETSDGKLKIAFVNEDEELITKSGLWWKFVYSIEIIEE